MKTVVTFNNFNNNIEKADVIIDEANNAKYEITTIEVTEADNTVTKKIEINAVNNLVTDGIKLTLSKSELKELSLLLNQFSLTIQN